MALSSGIRLGPYEILTLIGAGGMGEVYKAKDTRLDRIVAMKVLPAHLSIHPDQKQRFDREARTISSLSHSNICSLYDVGHQEGIDYLVMEFLEGETLAQTLSKRALTLDQIARWAVQIADALDKAHKQGIVHRDLKPANIMLTDAGVKLLDFGLAKLQIAPGQQLLSSVSRRPTEQGLTTEGTILGTLQYMAPEQVEGREADSRTDIFAFGSVLYEMTTNKKAFSGSSQARIIASILSTTPQPIASLNPEMPSVLSRLVQRCLEKNPNDRWQSARDIVLELKWISEMPLEQKALPLKKRNKILERAVWTAAVLALSALLLFVYKNRVPNVSLIRFIVSPPRGSGFDNAIALSPNGQHLIFIANDSTGNNVLWLRSLNSTGLRALQNTEGATFPFWSEDSQSIGFFAEGKLKRFDLVTNASQTICRAANAKGGTWNRDGVILFSANEGGAIYRVSSKGGNPTVKLSFDPGHGESTVRYPLFLPDNRHFLYYIWTSDLKTTGIYIGSLDSDQKQWLTNADSGAVYTPGYLIYLLSGDHLMAQRFDVNNLKMSGDPVTLYEGAWVNWFTAGLGAFSVSQNGILAYRTGGFQTGEFVWYDRSGKQLGKAGLPGLYAEPSLSPDEKKISFSGTGDSEDTAGDIWILEFTRGITSRLASGKNRNRVCSLWSPDGTSIAFCSYPDGAFYQRNLASGTEKMLLKLQGFAVTEDWSKDGRYIAYDTLDLKSNQSDIWILPMNGNKTPVPFVNSQYNESCARISPDGNWIAYTSDESGRNEVYVQSFPTPHEKAQISTAGGDQINWRGDSKEIFYVAPDNKMMSVDFHPGTTEQPPPKILFQSKIMPKIEARNHYVVTADGQRFLINTRLEETATSPIEVVLNWTASLQ